MSEGHTILEALEVARGLLAEQRDGSLLSYFPRVDLTGLPNDPAEAFMYCLWRINSAAKTLEQYHVFVLSQTTKPIVAPAADLTAPTTPAADHDPDAEDKTISQKMRNIVKMISVPKLGPSSSKKVDFYTQTQGAGPPVVRPPATLSAPNSSTTPSQPKSPAGTVSAPPPIHRPGHTKKSSFGKLADFFGADSEVEVDRMLAHMNPETRSIGEGTLAGYELVGPVPEALLERVATEGSEEALLDEPVGRPQSNRRAVKLARFFGLPASETNIGRIRTEMRHLSNLNFYRGCIGENVVKIHWGNREFTSSKSLLVTSLTTAEECIKIVLGKLGIASAPSNYAILEVSADGSRRVLQPSDFPLQIQAKWASPRTFLLRKNEATEDDEEEPAAASEKKAVQPADFGAGMLEMEQEHSSLLKALGQLEPSGTFFELPTAAVIDDGATPTSAKGASSSSSADGKRDRQARNMGPVMIKVYLSNRTHKKLAVSPLATVTECLNLMAEQMNVSPQDCRLYELGTNSADAKELPPADCLWPLLATWKDGQKILFRSARGTDAEAEPPGGAVSDDDDEMSVYSLDGDVVVYYGADAYTALSLDGETTTKQVLEQMMPVMQEQAAGAEQYGLFEVHDDGRLRRLAADECPLITKLNSLDSFRFEVRRPEPEPEPAAPPADGKKPLQQVDSVLGEDLQSPQAKRSAAKKRTVKLAGFFGVDASSSEVTAITQMIGTEVTDSLRFSKRRSVIRAGINREGWLQVRRDFEDLGKARWQHCWCILNKGELTICLGQRSKNEAVPKDGPRITLPLHNCTISSLPGVKKYAFKVVDQRGLTLEFAANSLQEETEWMNRLKVGSRLKVPGAAETPKLVAIEDSENPRRMRSLDDFEFLKVIGRGHFGKVLLCAEKATGEVYAIKVLKKTKFVNQKDVRNLQTERRVMKGLRHPFLVGLHSAFQGEDRLYLVMEYVNGGELFFHLTKDGYFKEERARFYAAEILSALTYLHGQGVIYRDLKLENVLMDSQGHMKITDFGLCKDELGVGVQTSTLCGTTEYMAPEVLLNLSYGFGVDWWSFGIVLYEMLCGAHPFYSADRDQLFYNTLHREVRYPNWISDDAVDLVESLLERNPLLRLGSGKEDGREVMRHPFFRAIDFKLLEERKLPVPYKPSVSGAADTSNIDAEFTKQNPVLTPLDKSLLQNVPNFDFMDD